MDNFANELFVGAGWKSVWMALLEKQITPREAAEEAEQMARKLSEVPPIDPFWIAGYELSKERYISNDLKVKVFVEWLERYLEEGREFDDKIKFEIKYLIDLGFINWGMLSNTDNHNKTLAEIVLISKRGLVFDCSWDWSKISQNEWIDAISTRPSRMMPAITSLSEAMIGGWSKSEQGLAESLLEMRQKYKNLRLNQDDEFNILLSSWENELLKISSNAKHGISKHSL